MASFVKMFCSMLVWRLVAAAYMTADQTDPEVYPPITGFKTLLTPFGTWGNFIYKIKMAAAHVLLLSIFIGLCSRDILSQFDRLAAASYVLCRNASSVSSGEDDFRTAS